MSSTAHVDDALQAEQGAGRGRGHAVLAGAGLGDDAALAHAHGEQRLTEHVVDLVGAGVAEVLALEVDRGRRSARSGGRRGRAASGGRRSRRAGARARPGRPRRRAPPRRRAVSSSRAGIRRLGHEAAAVGAEAGGDAHLSTSGVVAGSRRDGRRSGPAVPRRPARSAAQPRPSSVSRTAPRAPRRRTRAAGLRLCCRGAGASTPLDTSTAHGRTAAMASPTLPGARPSGQHEPAAPAASVAAASGAPVERARRCRRRRRARGRRAARSRRRRRRACRRRR